ncbi:endonuclease [Myroides phaeus]|uniref:endonuclease I family protein n=1 Tax=Myroides phaeus TaxID=702745 RepID=UPI002DBD158E|nr:endonuclease [Myroides phaeus]MEC4117084.1 endonuclease [Myroides phaeus]
MKNKLFLLLGVSLLALNACTKDPIITEPDLTPVEKPSKPTPPTTDPTDPGTTDPVKPGDFSNIPEAQKAYYAGVDFTKKGTALKADLTDKITKTHTKKLKYTPEVWEAIKATDYVPVTSGDPTLVYLVYGHKNKGNSTDKEAYTREISKQNKGGAGFDTWNREHVYTQDAGGFDTKIPGAATDVHNLRSADVDWNGKRGNLKFAPGNGYSGPITGGWYPGDEWKGDVARMMMYMYVRYGEQCLPSKIGVGSTTSTPDGMIDLFLKWNAEDPVSDIEKRRNDYHGNTAKPYAQGNRNPFIDNPYLATQIWGGPEAENRWK